jgi:hypothetical protein
MKIFQDDFIVMHHQPNEFMVKNTKNVCVDCYKINTDSALLCQEEAVLSVVIREHHGCCC